MDAPGLTLPFWLDLFPISGCMSDVIWDDGKAYELATRRDAINVAVQFVLDYLTTPTSVVQLEKDVVHEGPPGLVELVDKVCG
eukprot:9499083-Pyramimonas_sp.AAC.1